MKNYLGVDIGGSKIRVVKLVGFEKQTCEPAVFPTPQNLDELSTVLKPYYENIDLAGIGVSIAGSVLPNSGRISSAANLPFLNGVEVSDLFLETSVEIRIDNDARCFLRAELLWGAAIGKYNVIGFAFGTGIGAAIWRNGEFIVGEDGLASEFGHSIHFDGEEWEELAKKEIALTEHAFHTYPRGVAEVIRKENPRFIVLGGGPISRGFYDLEKFKKNVRKYLGSDDLPEIVFGTLGDPAQAIGAALQFKS